MPKHQASWLACRSTNLPFVLRRLSREIQAQTLDKLTHQLGYQQLRLSFEAYIALIEPNGSRQTELAQILHVSKQNCNQVISSIEAAGYLERRQDPLDGRGKLLFLTPLGKRLIADGETSIQQFEKSIVDAVGATNFSTANDLLLALCEYFTVPLTASSRGTSFSSLLFRFNDFTTQTLFASLARKGHNDIRPSYGQVLENISQQKMSVQKLADINKVSKQAIGAIAKHLQQLGYIAKHTHAKDGRQTLLGLSAKGKRLVNDSAAACEDFYATMQRSLGKKQLALLEHTLTTAFENFASDRTEPDSDEDIDLAAKQLINKMGPAKAKVFAKLLLQHLT